MFNVSVEVSDPSAEMVTALYEQHGGRLFSFAFHLTGDHERAEDVVQETFLRAWRTADRLDTSRDSLRPWLFTTARNIVIDLHRRDVARPDIDHSASVLGLTGTNDIKRALDTWQIEQALARLTAEHREVIVACHFRGETVAQASERLGIPAGTVKSRVYYALRALRVIFDELGLIA